MKLRIREKRESLKMPQKGLAEKLNVTQTVINNWERGVANPRTEMLPAIASALGCTIDDLYPEEEI